MRTARFEDLSAAIADACGPKPLARDLGLTGFSGARVIGLLQRLAALPAAVPICYLEVGVFQGLTLLSVAAAAPGRRCFGVDNFSQFDPGGVNRAIVAARCRDAGIENAVVVDRDYEDALASGRQLVGDTPIGCYFVDGPHDYRSQLMCLLLALPLLADDAVIVVDDSNYAHVRQANHDFLTTCPDWTLAFQAYTARHPQNMSVADRAAAVAGWWNGVNVLVRDPEHRLPRGVPPTCRDRQLFENEHLVHSSRYGAVAPESVALTEALVGLRPVVAGKRLVGLLSAIRRVRARSVPRFGSLNTFSAELPEVWVNPALQVAGGGR